MKKIIKDYFTFSKKERTAIGILLLLIGCFIAAPWVYRPKNKPPFVNQALSDYLARSGQMAVDSDQAAHSAVGKKSAAIQKESFPFDPNIIDENEWKRLGIGARTIRTILNYRNKGGKFRSAEDLRKIWGFRKEDADRLVPFVTLPKLSSKPDANNHIDTVQRKTIARKIIEPAIVKPIDINTATVEEWKALPGIGEVLSARIVKYRERAGSFRSVEQVHKIYGLADSVFRAISPYLKLDPATLPKLDINTATVWELRSKTNISPEAAKAIVVYRQQYGPFQSVNDLKKIVLVTDTMFQRIAGLLTIQ